MTLPEYESKKRKLLHDKEQQLLKNVSKSQQELLKRIFNDFVEVLEVKENSISNTVSNIKKLKLIDKVWAKFLKDEIIPIIKDYLKDLKQVHNLSVDWYKSDFMAKTIDNIQSSVYEKTSLRLGVTPQGKIIENSFLDNFIKDKSLATKLKKETLKAVTSKTITKKDLIKTYTNLLTDNDTNGQLTRYFKTFATDTYTQFDRTINNEFATKLGLKYARYSGGLIESSREFCEIRNNKVFDTDEIAAFGTSKDKYGGYTNKKLGEFQGKTDPYDPFIDCGGHNCRHTLNYITEKRYKQLLKQQNES